ncbi:MAG: hypothetical protein LC660_13725, partial [Desulfobacteraceae bacterium]|nr:hypothetical protein [Desulfobacteraceae bacterium]
GVFGEPGVAGGPGIPGSHGISGRQVISSNQTILALWRAKRVLGELISRKAPSYRRSWVSRDSPKPETIQPG